MVYVQQHTIGGVSTWVLLAEPNLDATQNLVVAYATELVEGRTGVASRRPERTVPRLSYAYDWIGGESDNTVLRNFFGAVGDGSVLVPLWFDLTGKGSPLFTSQVKVGWDAEFSNVAIGEGGSSPSRASVCPAVIGRLERPTEKYLTGKVDQVRIKIREDSPWAQRLDIAASGPVDFTWKPDWSSNPTEQTRDRMEYEQIGSGRVSSPSGDPVTTRRQRAQFNFQRSDCNDFLGWFRQHRGAFAAFAMPSFFQTGANTPQAPHQFDGGSGRGYMRFASDQLKIRFQTSQRCEVTCEFEQVLGTTTEEQPAFARLFEITSDADVSDVARLTDAEEPISGGGYTWTPARIELHRFRSSLKIQNDSAEVHCHLADVPQLAPIVRHETDIPVRCKIYHADRATDPATLTVLTYGRYRQPRIRGPRITFSVRPFDGILDRKIPRFMLSRTCNHSVFDSGCSRVNPTGMAKENWSVTGVFDHQWGANVIRVRSLSGVPGAMANNWFRWGWVEIGTGIDKQVRVVATSSWLPSGDGWADAYGNTPVLHLVLQRPVRTDIAPAGTSCVMYAGCDGSYSTCKVKFNNRYAFGGAPFAPSFITAKPRGMPTPGK